ncbi:MAG: pantoate--beta-alanine ligase [Nitrospiraceae bacterium]|nr:pantoate--beta-alanine ligase [Nitrospiraceae bacterium]
MKVIRTAPEMRAWSFEQRRQGRSIGFVPTMGALHEGHASLMRAAAERDDARVVSIFLNPAQFAPTEDLDRYPRTFDADKAIAEATGMEAIYAPTGSGMYPEGYATYVNVDHVSEGLCGASRPTFFRGVATVVAKLFNAVLPHRAYFGQKDAQQCAVIKRMVRDLDMDIEIVEMPIVRDPDGLAMSSRNAYLSAADRTRALALSRSLFAAQAMMEAGERDAGVLLAAVREGMADIDIDYVELVDGDDFDPVDRVAGTVVLAVAARVGETRLIDNIKYTVPAKA